MTGGKEQERTAKYFAQSLGKEVKAAQKKVLESKMNKDNLCIPFQELALKDEDTAGGLKACRGWQQNAECELSGMGQLRLIPPGVTGSWGQL